ncbi:hypothetical protein DVS77_15520 [Mycolicibacterium moriokaense]|nr:hypothetical protein DVS77_15520 [Mycolicibacterium moriokaense]
MSTRDDRVQKSLVAAQHLKRDDDTAFGAANPARGRRVLPGKRVKEQVEEQLRCAGIATEALERELAAERAESERRLAELREEAVSQSGSRAESLRHLLDGAIAAVDGLVATTGDSATQYQTLDSPVQIWATDGIDVVSTSIEPYKSQAKVRMEASYYTSFFGAYLAGEEQLLHFQYLWGNPRQDASAVVDVNAIVALNGFCSAHSDGGITGGGTARLDLEPTVDLIQTWTQPLSSAPPQPGQSYRVASISADSSGLFSSDHDTSAVVFRGTAVGYQQEIVPAGAYLIIDVALRFYSETIDGKVTADFTTGLFNVQSPFVSLAIAFP